MHKILKIIIFFPFCSSFSQGISPQSVNCTGKVMNQANGSLSFTVGDLVVLSQMDNDGNSLFGGFTSGSTISTAIIKEPDDAIINVKVFPNPMTDLVTVSIQETTVTNLILEVVDLNGEVVYTSKYSGISNNVGINTSIWSIGNYFLYLKNSENHLLGSFKIIKQ